MSPQAAPTHAGTASQPLPSSALYWPPETPMAITTRTSGTVTIVKLEGKLTADDGVAEFGETIRTLLENGSKQIVLNCDWVYVDGAGIHEIVKTDAEAKHHGAAIKVTLSRQTGCPVCSGVIKILTIFETFDDEAEAIASFGGEKA
jgi:anti-anti-sigma regulatory factor